MDNDYEAFCMADPVFYDAPVNATTSESYVRGVADPPDGWRRVTNGHWVNFAPEGQKLPSQGWKIHISARPDNAEDIIDVVWNYCIERHIAFKFLRSPRVVLARNAKYAGRGGSGKLVTLYPPGEEQLRPICEDLDRRLEGEAGPYILSDLRWGDGPVHVRYGGFRPRHCLDDSGERVLAIEDDAGELVPDVRGPVFALPPWVTLPDFLQPHMAARSATTIADLPYTIETALHFSNGGGVYAGVDRRSGQQVVLKEARPHAGLSGDGTDAVTRLRRERHALEQLAGIDAVPRLLDFFAVGEHEFLVMEHVPGEALNTVMAQRCPLLGATTDEASLADHVRWAQSVHSQVERTIAAIHQRGFVYGDLHMFNIIVRPTGDISLIDFEVADHVESFGRQTLGAPGFVPPRDRQGYDIDRYALACLKLALFLPLERLLGLDRAKAAHLAEIVAETFPVPRPWLDPAVAVITGPRPKASAPSPPSWQLEVDAAGWRRARSAIADAILASSTPERTDRLFPGDILQFQDLGGLDLATGAAGVLYTLDITGAGRHPDHEEWLIRRVHDVGSDARLGFYDGLHGLVHVLTRLGHHEDGAKLLDRCLDSPWELSSDELYGGLAGMGLNFAHMADATGDPALDDAAERATQLVADRLGRVEDVPTTSGGRHPYAGLLRGSAGRALLFVRMYERTGEPALLDRAATALRQDLRRCVTREQDGHLHVDEGYRTMPYLGVGSTGLGLVLRRYLVHRADEEMAVAAQAIRGGACAQFYVQPGLFNGRAGMVLYLSDTRRPGEAVQRDSDLDDQIRRLNWHAIAHRGGQAFPGDRLLRLSLDLATGSAGVLLALGAALHDQPVHLPFLEQDGGPATTDELGHTADDDPERR